MPEPRAAYPKRLIEVDLPIRRISAHARREKSIRHGHISTLHIWWARRPLAACRAVVCASLWPDPADPLCPQAFRDRARAEMLAWTAHERQHLLSPESRVRFEAARQRAAGTQKGEAAKKASFLEDDLELRAALLDFIADFSNWDNSTIKEFLETSRALTQSAHEALGGAPGTRPLVVDPFAGGGSIPLEALRVGADAFASDLNPVPVLLNKVVLEYIPKYGQRLADEVRKWGAWIKEEAEKELAEFYPKDKDGATPIAYLWARTIQCEGPGCGAEVPLIRSLWLAKKANRSVALQLVPRPRAKRVDFRIMAKSHLGWVDQDHPAQIITHPILDGTVKRGTATCPCCGYTTPVARVREQLKARHGGATDARMFCVATVQPGEQGRFYRVPTERDLQAAADAAKDLEQRKARHSGVLSLVPDEKLDLRGIRHTWAMIYGLERWGDYFTPRQALSLSTFVSLARASAQRESADGLQAAVQTVLGLAISRWSDICNSLCRWEATKTQVRNLFGRQAVPMIWDFAEPQIFADAAGNFSVTLETMLEFMTRQAVISTVGVAQQASAAHHPLPADCADAFVTDPPYYDAVPYSYLSDFFYVWLRRTVGHIHPDSFNGVAVPKDEEIVVDRMHELSNSTHDIAFYERELTKAFSEGRRIAKPDALGTIVFASKTTASWEAILKAVVDAGWIITGSWPIDTELENRVSAQGQARLASSVHLVCRPRENPDGSLRADEVGDWRDVLSALPVRIHEWMPRLAEEGVVGADAIFACLGPALEIFSRYARVEKANGEQVTLKEYLEHVWAAVSREALSLVFESADASGFDADARVTAMWLWTLKGDAGESDGGGEAEEGDADGEEKGTKKAKGGFALEYDAARKIAQGLGAHLENLEHLVEVSGETARLLPVAERARHLFGKYEGKAVPTKRRERDAQMDLFKQLQLESTEEVTAAQADVTIEQAGKTVLDRVHQSMILFAAGRGEAMRKFIVDDGIGRDPHFWKLAQALSALYPSHTDEKRWVDGVLARKKGLGF